MDSGTTPRVRFVRCPKCRLVLQEPEAADFPVYQCGGCDTILVAKNRKAVIKSKSLLQETKAAHADDESVRVSERGESSSSTPQDVLPFPPEYHFSQESGGHRSICSDSQSEKRDESLSVEGLHNDQNTCSDIGHDCDMLDENRSNEGQQNGSGQLQLESSEYRNVQEPGVSTQGSLLIERHCESMLVAEANLEAEENGKTLQLELETTNKTDSSHGGSGSSINNSAVTRETNSTVTACAAAGEAVSSDNLFSSDDHLEQPQKSGNRGFDRLESTNTYETADFVSVSSELSDPLPTDTRSYHHAYDGSISSCDGMDEHFSDQQIHSSSKNKYEAAKYLVLEAKHRRDQLPAKGMMSQNSGTHNLARNLSSDLFNKKHYATEKYSKWNRHKVLESRLERDEYPSKIPFSQRASLQGYGSAGPSRELHEEFPFDSAFHPLEKAEYNEDENVKLLRMVNELQDQISKTCHLNGKHNRRNSTHVPRRQKHFPTYYYQEPPEEESFYPSYHGRHGHRSSWGQQSRFSRIPFSGGALNSRHDIDNSCLCCHHQARSRSEQLLPPIFGHKREYSSYNSHPSSPQRYLEYNFSILSHATKTDDQRYRNHEQKRYLREKHHSVRQHLRPTAGGAPFVTCYHCFRPLQLPADFLFLKRRFHQLRCGACSKVLKFSLQKGIHIVPYEVVAAKSGPSKAEDCSDAINVRILKSASCSHGCLEADMYHSGYGQSCKSCSIDGIPVSHAHFHNLHGNALVKNMSWNSSKHKEPRKDFVLKQSQEKHKISRETIDSAVPSWNMSMSEKVSSEIEEMPRRTGGSKLHQLMGFSSPSQVINRAVSSISDTSSIHTEEENSGSNS